MCYLSNIGFFLRFCLYLLTYFDMKFVDQKMRIFKCISLCEDLVQNRILQEKEHNVQ